MLAMRFEDTIFKAATSLSDYRKKLTKRLKKVQKSYKPTNTVAATNKEELIKVRCVGHWVLAFLFSILP